jgi:pimeloyl-ACP methyl ester carboxylesterase
MVYKEWGDSANPNVLVCVHGVTRVSDDFDNVAAALCDKYRVICPDIVGRGRSDWLRNPAFYVIPQYMCDMITLLARLDVEKVDWIGTSMGGLIGIPLASLPGTPIRKLVLNDVGPALDMTSLVSIADYIGQDLRWATYEDAETYIRAISVPFGPHTDAEWHKMARSVLRQLDDGQWTRHYDIRLAAPFKDAYFNNVEASEALLWQAYDAIQAPTLLLRGAQSGLLMAETAQAMTQRGPRAKLVEFEGVGHAPTLMHEDQISVVKDFLLD